MNSKNNPRLQDSKNQKTKDSKNSKNSKSKISANATMIGNLASLHCCEFCITTFARGETWRGKEAVMCRNSEENVPRKARIFHTYPSFGCCLTVVPNDPSTRWQVLKPSSDLRLAEIFWEIRDQPRPWFLGLSGSIVSKGLLRVA